MRKKYVVLLLVIGMFLLFYSSMSFSKEEKGSYVGVETCKGCHPDKYESYAGSIHAKKAIPGSPANRNQCESCHGAGDVHVSKGGGKGTGMFAFGKKEDAKAKSEKCLACHEEQKAQAFWSMSKHKSAGVACSDCHTGHSSQPKNLKKSQPELCFGCHKDIKSQANKQSHHPIKEGKISCNDCHEPHGDFGPKMVKADTVNELCYKCHTEKRGPYMFEHPPVEENCLNCHTPHGSNHNKLLVKKMPNLCQSCHDWTQHPGTAYTSEYGFDGSGSVSSRNKLIARSCTNCHTNIHGGNGVGARGPKFTR
jgi:DmsE family decaheme c-type cytochrome